MELEVRSSKTTTDLTHLRATHEDADTGLVLHAVHARNQFNTIVMSSRDSDILPLPTFAMRTPVDDVWYDQETAIHTN